MIDFSLNGKKIPEGMPEHSYLKDFLERIGHFYPFVLDYDYRIASENNFPTAAGFASSASGFAALIKAIVGELEEFAPVKEDEEELSVLARLGSGSAARSMPSEGGFVIWHRGLDFSDRRDPGKLSLDELEKAVSSSFAETLFKPEHWPELVMIYCKVKAEEKKVKSRSGMKSSVETSPGYQKWLDDEEGKMKAEMIDAVQNKDFGRLSVLIMEASDGLHRICLETDPPLRYLNETSLALIDAVKELNKDEAKAAYTFDAGPNAVVFTLKKHEKEVFRALEGIAGKDNLIITGIGPGARYSEDHLF